MNEPRANLSETRSFAVVRGRSVVRRGRRGCAQKWARVSAEDDPRGVRAEVARRGRGRVDAPSELPRTTGRLGGKRRGRNDGPPEARNADFVRFRRLLVPVSLLPAYLARAP
jgi:hypothetical protein